MTAGTSHEPGRTPRRPNRPNGRLRAAREARGWSREGLAERMRALAVERDGREVSPDKTMAAKWELGTRAVSPYYRVLLCILFETSAENLGFLEPEEEAATWQRPDEAAGQGPATAGTGCGNGVLGRRGFAGLAAAASVTAAAAVATPATAGTVAPARGKRADEVLGDPQEDLSAITARLRSLDWLLGPRYVLDEALAHQSLIVTLLRESARSQRRKELASEAADITGFIAWLAFDTNAFDASFAHYRAAASLADDAGDSSLHAWVLGGEAAMLKHLGNDKDAISVLEAAQQVAAGCPDPTTRSWLAAISCETYARLGDHHAAWKAYGAAEKLLGTTPTDDAPSRLSCFHRAHLLFYGGVAHLASGNPGNARRELERALAIHPPHLVRERAKFQVRLAEAHLANSDLDAACSLLGDAFEIATRTGSSRIIEQVQTVRGSIPRRHVSDRTVRELDERLATAPSIA